MLAMPSSVRDQDLAQKLSGQILLQVESHGKAWYVNPANEKKYYLGKPIDAFNLMRNLGTGITNKDLAKIPIGNLDTLPDDDQDGLNNATEIAIGTDPNKPDTDNDGFLDGTEINNNYNPLNKQKIITDKDFAAKNLGKIFLQVENKGQAWYINPKNKKRYFLGQPNIAFQIMRHLSTGITNNDLDKIQTANNNQNQVQTTKTIIFSKGETRSNLFKKTDPSISNKSTQFFQLPNNQSESDQNPTTIPSTKTTQVTTNTIYNAASSIRSGNTTKTLSYFTPAMQNAIEYTMNFLDTDGKLALGNILSSATLQSSTENKKIYSAEVYFGLGGYKVPVNFHVEKQDNGEWLMVNL